jgi:[protein-PII] uridylyltransferase
MRDFHEPQFLATFTEKMENQIQLDMLYCLTYADARAVGEGVLTGWQEAILHELHATVGDQLKQHAGSVAGSRYQRLVRDLQAIGVSEDEAQEFIRDLGQNYLHQVPKGEVEKHYQVLNESRAEGVGLSHAFRDKYVYIAAALPDRHGLFADVNAALTGHGFDILDARTWVTKSGMVIYSFRTSSIFPSRLQEKAAWDKLRKDLLSASAGSLEVDKLLEKRRKSYTPTNKRAKGVFDDPAVKVEQRTSAMFTIVDVLVEDDIGLLSRLCRAISDNGCEIGYACINTMGDVAVDVFYVNRGGRKLTDEEAESLRQQLIAALGLKLS